MATEIMTFNETEIRFLYKLLNHGTLASRVHCQDPNVPGKPGVLSATNVVGENAVVEWAKKWNGKGQCYISRNAQLGWNQPAPYTTLTFDLDPVYDKKLGATDVQSAIADQAGRRIVEKFAGGYIARSGNGVLLLYRLPSDLSTELNGTLHPAYKALVEQIKAWIEPQFPVKLDILPDPERLIRLIGTMNVRGDKANHRLSKFLYLPPAKQAANSPMITRLREIAKTVNHQPVKKVLTTAYEPWVVTALEGLPEEGRHPLIIRLAGYFGGKHIPIEITKKLIHEANTKGPNPYSEAEVEDKIDDVYLRIRSGRYRSDDLPSNPETPPTIEIGTFRDGAARYLETLKAKSLFTEPEIPWPFPELNKMTWGLPRGTITSLGAWTGKGKTSIALTLAESLTAQGKKVLYFPTEMPQDEIKGRFLSIMTGIYNIHLFNGQVMNRPDDKARLESAYEEFLSRPFYLPKKDMPRLSLYELKRAFDTTQPDIVIVDFLQRLSASASNRRREVAEFIMALKDEISTRKVAGLVLSQFHRPDKAQNGKYFPPSVFDFAECGDIENTSDIAILLHPPIDEKGYIVESTDGARHKPVLCNVAKNRHSGITGMTYLRVDTLTTRYEQV